MKDSALCGKEPSPIGSSVLGVPHKIWDMLLLCVCQSETMNMLNMSKPATYHSQTKHPNRSFTMFLLVKSTVIQNCWHDSNQLEDVHVSFRLKVELQPKKEWCWYVLQCLAWKSRAGNPKSVFPCWTDFKKRGVKRGAPEELLRTSMSLNFAAKIGALWPRENGGSPFGLPHRACEVARHPDASVRCCCSYDPNDPNQGQIQRWGREKWRIAGYC